MEGSVEEIVAPDSWEVADLDESMGKLMVSSSSSSSNNNKKTTTSPSEFAEDSAAAAPASSSSSNTAEQGLGLGFSDDVSVNQLDQFLREALQNPRERVSILRMEQDVEKFIRDPMQQQLEFQQLPTSYLRLAAHRVAQHYSLQSMVVLDNNLPDGSGSKIVVRKTSESRFPLIRLADIPITLPQEENPNVVKVAIKQRPQKRAQIINSANAHSSKANHQKSVEERKEEYNRARARIFSANSGGKQEGESTVVDSFQLCSLGPTRLEEKSVVEGPEISIGRGVGDSSIGGSISLGRGVGDSSIGGSISLGRGICDSSTGSSLGRGMGDSSTGSSSRSSRGRMEKEPFSRYKTNNRVAIFRDREVDSKDPDYDRTYERYAQRFDPGFGFNGGPFTMQTMFSPALNYNTEFPQLGSAHRPQISIEHQPRPVPQHMRAPWGASSAPTPIGYGHPESMLAPYNPNHVGAHTASAIYLHSSQYPCPRPGMAYVHPHEQVHQPFAQSHQQQPEASFGLARPR
eukprot:TRINITY_DN16467_c0_g1_i1.p1 TRINITY_DN16467_c0_g1~~TRINITY_DN16467_c0_g1_i1.p1  ORF type:complete len:516 (+),score=98.74 TRINITY_DN16467_c0_g1_i1:260-1807(+)